MAFEIHLNDIGTIFDFEIIDQDQNPVDLRLATTLQAIFLKPDGITKITKTCNVTGAAADGVIRYISVSGDITPIGKWQVQCRVVIGTSDLLSNKKSFKVFPNL